MSNPIYHAPNVGDTYQAGDINQFLFTHPTTFIYQGSVQESGATSTTGTLNTNTGSAAQWITQPFTTGASQTTVTRAELKFASQGTGADLTIDLQTDNAGSPSGTVLASISFPKDFQIGTATIISIPFGITGLTPNTQYHIVVHGTIDTANFVKLSTGTTAGTQAMVSPDGVSWSTAGVSLVFNTFAGTNGNLRHTMEDIVTASPKRWTGLEYQGSLGSSTLLITYREDVGALRSKRTLGYVGSGLVTII